MWVLRALQAACTTPGHTGSMPPRFHTSHACYRDGCCHKDPYSTTYLGASISQLSFNCQWAHEAARAHKQQQQRPG
jgi:hypothetical protein